MDIEFEEFSKKHLESVLDLERNSFEKPWNRRMFEQELGLKFSKFIVARSKRKIVGYGGIWISGETADIVNIAVHPRTRNRGVGSALVRRLESLAAAQGARQIFLEVRSKNAAARRLYSSLGFTVIGQRARYYGDDDAVVMKKEITK